MLYCPSQLLAICFLPLAVLRLLPFALYFVSVPLSDDYCLFPRIFLGLFCFFNCLSYGYSGLWLVKILILIYVKKRKTIILVNTENSLPL